MSIQYCSDSENEIEYIAQNQKLDITIHAGNQPPYLEEPGGYLVLTYDEDNIQEVKIVPYDPDDDRVTISCDIGDFRDIIECDEEDFVLTLAAKPEV